MKGNKFTFPLILSVLIVFFCFVPAMADDDGDCSSPNIVVVGTVSMEDKDCDGVPNAIEDSGPGLVGVTGDGDGDGWPDSEQAEVASFQAIDGSYMTLSTGAPGLELRNVAAIDSIDGEPRTSPETMATPHGFISFDLIGLESIGGNYFNVSFFMHEDQNGPTAVDTLVRYASQSCENDFSNPTYYEQTPITDSYAGVGTLILIQLVDGAAGDPNCPQIGTARFIGAPAIKLYLDEDFDNHNVFVDNCPKISNEEQIDSDNDGIGDDCDNCQAVANFKQLDANGDGIGDMCQAEERTSETIVSYLGHANRHIRRDFDKWEFYATAGSRVVVRLQSHPDIEDGFGKKVILALFGKTRGAHLLRIDRSTLDPENMVEAVIPKDGTYCILVGQPFRPFWRWSGKCAKVYRGEVELTVEAQQEILKSIRATHWVEE